MSIRSDKRDHSLAQRPEKKIETPYRENKDSFLQDF